MTRQCLKCKYWSKKEHHPESKAFWRCDYFSNSKGNQYTAFEYTCKHWKKREES